MAPFSFPKGEKGFQWATTCNFSFSYFNSIRAISPEDVNVKAENAPSSAKEKEKKTGRISKVVPKGMQSLQRKINADSAKVKGEEAPKGGLQRKVSADTPKNKR
jgi:CRISPR/Cas system type I-B associated protein Csh2 (Cas7 group RAMP superfamily)